MAGVPWWSIGGTILGSAFGGPAGGALLGSMGSAMDAATTSNKDQGLDAQGNQGIYNAVIDPAKYAVSNKLSSYLTSQIGQPLPPYTGDLTSELDPMAQSRYNEFLSMDPASFFKKTVTDPTMQKFTEDILPNITESYAGNLRGSGRYSSELGAMDKLVTDIGTEGAKRIPEIYKAQLAEGNIAADRQAKNQEKVYTEWLRQQPENNPALEMSLRYLGAGTETGLGWGWNDMATEYATGGGTDWLSILDRILGPLTSAEGGGVPANSAYTQFLNANTV